MKCEHCGADLARGSGKNPSLLIRERQEEWSATSEWLEKVQRCERTAQGILDARALYPDKSRAWLYDDATMPNELIRAHQENDRAVMALYGFTEDMSESQIVAELMKMYQQMVQYG